MTRVGDRETTAGLPVLPTWVVGVPAVVLLGLLALLGRAGVGIQMLGLPLGAYLTPAPTVIVLGLVAMPVGRRLLRSLEPPQRRVAVAVAVAVGVGLLRAAAQGMPTLLRFQDMAYLLHLPWIVVGMVAMRILSSDEERSRVLRWIAWTLAAVLALHWGRGVIAPVSWLFDTVIAGLEGLSDKPDLVLKAGDRALAGLALGALALSLHRSGSGAERLLVITAGALTGFHVISEGSRGALLGGVVGTAILLVHRSSQRHARATFALAVVVGGILLSAVALSSPETSRDSNPARPTVAEPGQTSPKRDAVVPPSAQRLPLPILESAGRSGTVQWRLDIWRDVVIEWNSSWSTRLAGIGFGVDIAAMTVPGRQGFDGLNRGVHSIFFTIVARQGVLGVAVALALLVATIRATWVRNPAVAVLLGGIVIGLFDVFLEGVQAPVTLWLILGLLSGHARSDVSFLHAVR